MHTYRRISAVLFPIALIALIATVIWAYNQNQLRNQVTIKAENQYQRSFHNLSYHIDRIHQELGNTLAMSTASTDSYRKGLMNIWRLTSEAKSEVTQLPLLGVEFNKTDQFLANVANFTYQAGLRDFGKKPLNEKEVQTLNALYTHSDQISKDLRGLQSKVIANQLRWTDVELAMTGKGPRDNMIVDGFQAMEKQVSGYSDVQWDPAISGMLIRYDLSKLQGKDMTAEEVQRLAAQFFGVDPGAVQVKENGPNQQQAQSTKNEPNKYFRSYTAQTGGTNGPRMVDFTLKGGHPYQYRHTRPVGAPALDVSHATNAGQQFLHQHNYKDMTPVSFDRTSNTADITFARKVHETVVYPEKITVKVALDNGEVIGMQASDYVFNRKDREAKGPELSAADARKNISKNLSITKEALAIIQNDRKEDVLCYELTGKSKDHTTYRIYINADTGSEEKIETIEPEDAQPLK